MFRLPAVCVALAAASALCDSPPAWRLDRLVDGVRVEVRDVPGSAFEEVRVTTQSALPLKALCEAVWGKDAKAGGDFRKRVVISETETDRWTYEQIHVPVVSDRDYVMHVTLEQGAETGSCQVKFETSAHADWPVSRDFVRLRTVRGHWLLNPQPDGKVDITYVVYSDPGGSVPAFLSKGGQRDAALSFMKTILARAQVK